MFRRIALRVLTAMGLATGLAGPLPAVTYYVDQSHLQAGDDNTGTEGSPWKTINHAAKVLRAGDTVLVKQGTYGVGASEDWAVPAVAPASAGAADAPITFQACPGHPVTITTSGGQAAVGSNRDYVVWDGFTVDMADRMKFGEYTANRQRLTLDQMRAAGFEEHSRVVSSVKEVFEDEVSYRLTRQWKTAGKQAEPPGPKDAATVLDVSR